MGRIAVMEDVEGIREEEDVGDVEETAAPQDSGSMDVDEALGPQPKKDSSKGKYVATLPEVLEAFDAINTLRYSQPTHLQGSRLFVSIPSVHMSSIIQQENAKD
jgi:cleavage and polyadenylation specificity factor subunit 2